MRPRTLTTSVAVLATAMLLFASCGAKTVEVKGRAATPGPSTTVGNGPGSSVQPTTSTPSTTSETNAPTTVTETTAPATAPDTTVVGATGRSDEAFCAAAGKILDSGLNSATNLDFTNPDPQQMMAKFKEMMGNVDTILGEMDRTAPPAIADDMHTVATTTSKLLQALQSSDDARGLFNGAPDLSESTGNAEATARVGTYILEHCGFSLEGTALN